MSIYVALAFMTAIWITVLLWAVLGDIGPPLVVTVGVLAGLVLIPLGLSRWLRGLDLKPSLHRGILVGAFVFLSVLIVSSGFYNNYGLLGGEWMNRLLGDELTSGTFANQVTSLLLVGTCWWLGITLGDVRLTSTNLSRYFYVGLLLMALPAVFFVSDVSQGALWLYLAYLFAALVALGLTRVEEAARRSQNRGSPFTFYWFVQIGLAAGGIIVLVGLAHALKLGYGFGLIIALIAPVITVLIFPIIYAGAKLLVLSGFRLAVSINTEGAAERVDAGGQANVVSEPSTIQSLCAGLFLLIGFLVVVRLVLFTTRRWRQMAEDFGQEEQAALPSLGDQLSEALEERLARLGLNLPGMGRLRRRLAARSIRRIYASMTALAAERGNPRPAARTPYEHRGALRRAFPDCEIEIGKITEAYVAVHYGEVPETREALAEIRMAWQQVRETANHTAPTSGSAVPEV